MAPLKSMEQLAPLAVFVGFQLLEVANHRRKARGLTLTQTVQELLKISLPAAGVLFVVGAYLYSVGYFGPLTARVRGLFVKHTRTGNPLVDSVAEHQPGSTAAYQTYLHHVYVLAPIGFVIACARATVSRRGDANFFLILWGVTAYYFASKMSRLVILLGPVASALGGVALGFGWDYLILRRGAVAARPRRAAKKEGKEGKGRGTSKKAGKQKNADHVWQAEEEAAARGAGRPGDA